MPKPTNTKAIVKKRRAPFYRMQAERHKRIGYTWRRPRGIDSAMRRGFRGQRPLVRIGYGSDKATKFLRPNHFYTFLVKNVKDLDLLLMHNREYAAEIAHNVGYKTRVQIVERAAQLDIKVTNANARVRTSD